MPARAIQAAALGLLLAACRTTPAHPDVAASSAAAGAVPAWEKDSPLLPLPASPAGLDVDLSASPVPLTPEKVRLGRWLFFDARLSADGTVSCATCHRPDHGFSDTTPVSTGVRGGKGTRKSPTIINAGFPVVPRYFWDGRAATLVEQAKGPITNPVEMANTLERATATIAAIPGYRRAFRQAFGDERIDIERIAEAIAAYEVTRLSGGSAYDRFNAGDEGALSDEAQRGMEIFFGRGRCNACHLGRSFSDGRFHNIGIGYRRPDDLVQTGFVDGGRYAISGDPADVGAFKTPSLRDLSKRAPYMHDGSSPDLTDALFDYIHVVENPWLDPAMDEVRIFPFDVPALLAFLEALEGTGYEDSAPPSFPQ